MKILFNQIASKNHFEFEDFNQLHGGDINKVFLLRGQKSLVVKINDVNLFPGMFTAEAKGLKLLESSNSFRVPKVLNYGKIDDQSYLLIEYIEEGQGGIDFNFQFAEKLVKLHKITQDTFGLDHHNYIGSLSQINNFSDSASQFYISQRLEPQIRMAFDKGFKFKEIDSFYKNSSNEIPDEAPALIHGDLWAGNFLIDTSGTPVLIDPAVSFASREMDLAMMKLFGGFDSALFTIYDELFSLEPQWQKRIKIWQLYYLLVHLNLFGSGYYSSVKDIIKRYS